MKSIRMCAVTAVMALGGTGFAADADAANNLSIKRSQALSGLAIKSKSPATVSPDDLGARRSEQATLAFRAYGRSFNIELERNERLTDDLDLTTKAQLEQRVKLYRGRLAGSSDSWARINQIGDKLSGMIWDGKEIFVIDAAEDIATAANLRPSQRRQPLIYRLKDAVMNAQCALDANGQSLIDYDALVKELKSRAQALPQAQDGIALPAAAKQLSIAVVADTLFVQANSADPQAAVAARMNVVDGIYSGQVGVELRLASVLPLGSNGTLTSTAPSTLLSQFGAYASSGSFTNPGLAHLLTNRDLDGSTVGIAYLRSLCSARYGVGVSQQSNVGTAGAIIIAHEIGHNFGAPHDNQSGSTCATTPSGFIMNPSVSSSSNTFSSCSLSQMAPVIAAAACIGAGTGGGGGGTSGPSISVTPTSAAAGGSVTVNWSGITNASPTNWIGLYAPGASSQAHNGNWMYVSCTQTATITRSSGSCTFPLPSNLTAGTYEMRLHAPASWSMIATSGPLTITGGGGGGTGGPSISVTPTSAAAGGSVTVNWNGITNASPTNWIGLYTPGASSQAHNGNWMYVSCTQTATITRSSGSCTFPLPSNLAAGTYEMRLHAPASWSMIATSGPLTITGGGGGGTGGTTISVTPTTAARGSSVTVSWSGIVSASPTNWIGLYVPGASDQAHNGNWMYVSCSQTASVTRTSGSCAFPLPATLTPGTYEFRMHASSSWTPIATSSALTVQ